MPQNWSVEYRQDQSTGQWAINYTENTGWNTTGTWTTTQWTSYEKPKIDLDKKLSDC